VTSIEDIVRARSVEGLCVLLPAGLDRRVTGVSFVEDLAQIGGAPADSLIILGERASGYAPTYRFDVAVRRAAAARASGLVLREPWGAAATATAVAAARRARLALLQSERGRDPAALAAAIAMLVEADADRSHRRIDEMVGPLLEAAATGDLETVARALGASVGHEVDLEPPGEGDVAAVVEVLGERVGWLRVSGGTPPPGTRALLALAAHATANAVATQRASEEVSERSRAEVLSELVGTPLERATRILDLARRRGLPIDGWHLAVHLVIGVDDRPDEDVARFDLLETCTRIGLQAIRAGGGTWNYARSQGALLFVRSFDRDPGSQAPRASVPQVERALAQLAARFPDLRFAAGIGGCHPGLTGLRASAAQARAAAATNTGRARKVNTYDATGLERTLLEWYASDSAREAVASLLAPFERLGPRRAEQAIRTLQVYLDEQGSLARAAARLHLHRNAVLYRIKRIEQLLAVDLDDPDERLSLQLACRAWLLSR
jgi:hypothetical protein